MRYAQPISFVYRNIVFAAGVDDAWALFRLTPASYGGLSRGQKLELLAQLAAFAYGVDADFQLLRVSRAWSVERYRAAVEDARSELHGHPRRLSEYLEQQCELLAGRSVARAEVYLSVRLGTPPPAGLAAAAARLLALRDARGISRRRLEALLAAERRVFAHARDYLDCERATTLEFQWLVRRGFCAGVGEPRVEEGFVPQALVIAEPGGEAFRPLEVDVMRLFEEPIDVGRRALRVDTEAGESHQALLVVGALPATATFPGRQAELLFAPLEGVDFPVDACFAAAYVPNDRAVALARRRIVDADHVLREESSGDHGPSAGAAARPALARELEHYLTAGERPPLLRATISLRVAAADATVLERRVEELRREFGPVSLHRPLGEQLRLFVGHLPGRLTAVRAYEDYLSVEQLGAMVPAATHAVGSAGGLYIGHTLSGSRQPVLLDLREASRTSRPPAIVCAGSPGSGKTVAVEQLAYQAFLLGSRVVDLDPKGDHRLAELCGEEHVERTVLTGEGRYRGMLDPLRIGSADTRADLAFNFLLGVLPEPVLPGWQTELRIAVDAVAVAGGRSCGDVVDLLERGNVEAREAARAIRVHARSGLLGLGFAEPGTDPPVAGARQVTSISVANLTVPDAATSRASFSTEERVGHALLHLLAAYALALMGSDTARHKTLVFDEAWLLLGTPAGRALLQRINRLGRSLHATPLLATQMVGDVGEMEGLVGAVLAFGVESEDEARRALRLLRLDPDDERLRESLLGFRRGRALMRDYRGRVEAIQVEVTDAELLAKLDTTPPAEVALEQTAS